MPEYKFTLTRDPGELTEEVLVIDEPVGWSDIQLVLKRDRSWHGVFFEYGSTSLRFYGEGALLIRDAYYSDGMTADVKLVVEAECGAGDWFVLLDGRLNFKRLSFTCDDGCLVSIPVEQDTCLMKLRARMDTPVDLDSLTAIDGKALPDYPTDKISLQVPSGGVFLTNDAKVKKGGDLDTDSTLIMGGAVDNYIFSLRPSYERVAQNAIGGQLTEPAAWASSRRESTGEVSDYLSPCALLDPEINCLGDAIHFEALMHGTIKYNSNLITHTVTPYIRLYRGEWTSYQMLELLAEFSIGAPVAIAAGDSHQWDFNQTVSADFIPWQPPLAMTEFGLFAVIELRIIMVGQSDQAGTVDWTFAEDTRVLVSVTETCESTSCSAYPVMEALSRVVESCTDGCLTAYSSLYGRIDSSPHSVGYDGEGGLRVITNGMFLRQSDEAKMKITAKDLFEGLKNIDCSGIGLEEDPADPAQQVLRFERFDYFYQPIEVLALDNISGARKSIDETLHFNEIEVGFDNWDTGTVGCSIGEYNSERLYSTAFNQDKNRLSIKSKFSCGVYAIEEARHAAIARFDKPDGDTSNDDKIFLLCVGRDGLNYIVEQGNITSSENIVNPNLVINYRITPIRNLIRWFRYIISGYRDYTTAVLKYTEGKGLVTAKAMLDDDVQRVESVPVSESSNINISEMREEWQAPIWRPEKIVFDYPITTEQYLYLRARSKGYIGFQCGTGDWEQGWIDEIRYKPGDGMASFTLLKKHD